MPAIPTFILKKLYLKGSLRSEGDGFAFQLKNTIAPGTISGLTALEVDGQAVPTAQMTIAGGEGEPRSAAEITNHAPMLFPVGAVATIWVAGVPLEPGQHHLVIRVIAREVGPLDVPITDTV